MCWVRILSKGCKAFHRRRIHQDDGENRHYDARHQPVGSGHCGMTTPWGISRAYEKSFASDWTLDQPRREYFEATLSGRGTSVNIPGELQFAPPARAPSWRGLSAFAFARPCDDFLEGDRYRYARHEPSATLI